MHAAQIAQWGQSPKYVQVDTPPSTPTDSTNVQIKVSAAGLYSLVRSRAAGTHYSANTMPHIPGTDGVGTTADGQDVYFSSFATGGSFCDLVNVPKQAVTPLPSGVDRLQAAAFVNPGLSSWMALQARSNAPPNFSVLIMGATSASGSMAISIARALGAGKVVGCARNVDKLKTLGLDDTIPLLDPVTDTDFSKMNVDVVLDYMYGPPAEHLLKTLPAPSRVQYLQIGCLAGLDITLPGPVLRSKNIIMKGSGPGSFSMEKMGEELPKLLEAFKQIKPHKLRVVPFSQIESAWDESGERTVFVP